MPKLTIVVGVGGSGKSTLCEQLKEESQSETFVFKDATLTKSDSRRAGHECLGEIVARLLGCGQDCLIDEPHLANPDFREEFKSFCDKFLPDVEQEWIFFEKDALNCINNLYYDAVNKNRIESERFKAVKNQLEVYSVPSPAGYSGFKVQPVYKQDNPRFSDLAEALHWLNSKIDENDNP